MKETLAVTYRHFEPALVVQEYVKERQKKLQRWSEYVVGGQVVLSRSSKNGSAYLYETTIQVQMPGKTLVSGHNCSSRVIVSMHQAFDDMIRQLEEYVHFLQGRIKAKPMKIIGTVVRLFDGYGFIESADGEEYYFNDHVLTQRDFSRLRVGSEVHFVEFQGDSGLQAHRVTVHKRLARAA